MPRGSDPGDVFSAGAGAAPVGQHAGVDVDTRETVERLLTRAWDGDVRVGAVETLRAGKVHRVHVRRSPAGAPATVLLKTALDEPGLPVDPDATEGNPAQLLLEEWAGLEFLGGEGTHPGLVPRFYAGDRERCLVLSEDVGAGDTLVETLCGDDPVLAEFRLTEHARALARLHAVTIGREGEYRRIRDGLGPRGVDRSWRRHGIVLDTQGWGDLRSLRDDLAATFEHLGQRCSPAFWAEYDELVETVGTRSPFRTYVHSDSCPDNVLFTSSGTRLVDFERGGFHFCLLDAAYPRLSMPHCFWAGRIPLAVTAAAESAYRQTLAPTIPEVADDRRFGQAMTAACAYWIVSNGTWLVHRGFDADFGWGPATWRQRVFLRLQQFAATSEEFDALPAMGAAARETISRLHRHWEFQDVPVFPAFGQVSRA